MILSYIIYHISYIISHISYAEDGYDRVEDLIGSLLQGVRPDAIALVDSFGYLDVQVRLGYMMITLYV